ncbi:MAG: glycosyltransferase family 4 protein, partial [Planctomycetaceae bacterium]
AEARRINPALKVLGFQPRVLPLFEQCDLVLVPSRYREGLPTALIESAATGRPVVTTNNYGGRDIIFHEKTGLMVEVGDGKGMADCLQRYIEDPMFALRMAENNYQQFLGGYTKKHMLQRTVEVFQSLDIPVPNTDLIEAPNDQQNQTRKAA